MVLKKKKNTSFNIPTGRSIHRDLSNKKPSKRTKKRSNKDYLSVETSVNQVSNVGTSSKKPSKRTIQKSQKNKENKKSKKVSKNKVNNNSINANSNNVKKQEKNAVDVEIPQNMSAFQETLLKAQDFAAKKQENATESTQSLHPVSVDPETSFVQDLPQQNNFTFNDQPYVDTTLIPASDVKDNKSSEFEEKQHKDKGYKSIFDEDDNQDSDKEKYAEVTAKEKDNNPDKPVKREKNEEITKEAKDSLKQRKKEKRKKKFKNFLKVLLIVIAISLVLSCVGLYIYLYQSDMFTIENIEINGVNHLTQDEMGKLANVEEDTTLLRVDTDTIKTRLLMDAWIDDVDIVKEFPSTLVINVKERSITAIVEVPTSVNNSKTTTQGSTVAEGTVRNWAISKDHMWLMPVPDKNSEAAKNINQQIYKDVEGVMHIVDVSPSINPEIGSYCTDKNVNCAIDVVASMTTSLVDQVKNVKASDPNSTTLMLTNGVEIALGTAEDIRDKERVCLDLLSRYEGSITYINVRDVNNPTWRTV